MSSVGAAISSFIAAHDLWTQHTHAPKDKYIFAPGDAVVLSGLTNKTEYNGLTGVIDHYIPSTDRFSVVRIGDREDLHGNVRPCNLSVQSDAVTLSPIRRVLDAFFRRGMRYFGTIQIPGDAGYQRGELLGKRQAYELTVVGPMALYSPVHALSDSIEALLGTSVLARHRAYDDEQFVFIRVSDISCDPAMMTSSILGFSMEYSDAETTCRGTWNAASNSFNGTVSQKQNSTDEIFVKADPVTHTFDLYPCHHAPEEGLHTACTTVGSSCFSTHSNHRAASAAALERCLAIFLELAAVYEPPSPDSMCRELRDRINWSRLLDASSIIVERTCAYIRLLAIYLDELQFASPSSRAAEMQALARHGVSRCDVHALCDQYFSQVRYVLIWWHKLHPSQIGSLISMQVARYRLDKSYDRFSKALRAVSCRLTHQTLKIFEAKAAEFVAHTHSSEIFADEACCICMEDLHRYISDETNLKDSEVSKNAESPLALPCAHMFHGACIKSWLHFHTQCPMCRLDLVEEADN